MKRTTTHMKLKTTGISLVLVLFAAPAAHGKSMGNAAAPAARGSAALAERASVTQSHHPSSAQRIGVAREPGGDRLVTPGTGPGGLTWRDVAIGTGIAVGIVLLGLWGDVAVGVVLLAVGALIDVGAALVARRALIESSWPSAHRKPTRSAARPEARQPATEPDRP